ncbi:MAG: LLM class flavin-dependent oxidoreductase [Candidatus Lokiarchaeia archaeon]
MLKFGTVGPTFPPINRIPEQAKRLEERGYDSIWFPDHLMGWYPQAIWTPDIVGAFAEFSPHVFFETTLSIALAASSTSKLLIGSAVTEPIRHHPAMLAQSFATLEHITNGRVVLGIGAGEKENCEPFGLPYTKIVSRLEEALQIIRLCWDSERDELLNFDGKFWTLREAVFELPPLKGRPPICIGGAGPRMAKLVGTYADGWMPFMIDYDNYKNRLQIIKEAAGRAGRDYDKIEKGLYTSLIIDKSHDECIRIMQAPLIKARALTTPSEIFEKYGYEHPLGKKFYGLTDFVPSRFSKKEALEAIEKVPLEVVQEAYMWGTPEEVIEKLNGYIKLGMEHWGVWNETYFGDATKVSSSYRCLGEVMKYFKEQ